MNEMKLGVGAPQRRHRAGRTYWLVKRSVAGVIPVKRTRPPLRSMVCILLFLLACNGPTVDANCQRVTIVAVTHSEETGAPDGGSGIFGAL